MKVHLFLALLLTNTIARAQVRADVPQDVGPYEITCFCNLSGTSPESIIHLDNNRQILLASRTGKTRAQLKSEGINYTDSQLQLLFYWNLLEDREGTLVTSIPMLDSHDTEQLRGEMKEAARAALPELRGDVAELLRQLQGIDREKSAFTILFSYVLDQLVWKQMERDKLIEKRAPVTAERPFWSGVVWASGPPRKFAPGTNSYSDQGLTLNVSWSDSALSMLGPFLSAKEFIALFQQFQKNGKIVDPLVLKTFAPYGIADNNGNFTVPIIIERPTDRLYEQAEKLAVVVTRAVRTHVPLSAIQGRYGLHNTQETVVIAYHEFMWELLDQLAAEHIVNPPGVLVAPTAAQPSDVGYLVFIVRAM
jgi:hypothetical protein